MAYRKTEYVGLTAAAQKFIRRHTPAPSKWETPGIHGEPVPLAQWRHTHPGSHIKMMREQAQIKPVIGTTMYIFTYLEVEYACGCIEPMFKWRENMDSAVCNWSFDVKRGMISM
jgi:hypothetical protein